MAKHESALSCLVHEGRWEQWQAEHGWEAGQDALLMACALPDAGGLVHGQAAACLPLFGRLRAPWQRLKVRPEVGVWTDDYSNLLRVFDWKN